MQLPTFHTASVPTTASTPKPNAPGPAIIDSNNHVTPPPWQVWTHAQHQSSHVHLINSTITKALMPLIDLRPTISFPAHGYISATQALHENTYGLIHKANSPITAGSVFFIGAIIDNDTGNVLEYCHLIKSNSHQTIWQHSFADEPGRLFQEIRDIKGTDTCFFICKHQIPRQKQQRTVGSVATIVPKRTNRIALNSPSTGDWITYDGNKNTPIATLVTAKVLINSTNSAPKAKFYGMDLANFYLMTPMKEYEYMQLRLELIPDEIICQYNLKDLANEQGWVYIKIWQGMYGLPQTGILANKLLEQHLNAKGYYHCQHTPSLWCQVWRDISFCLLVDVGIKSTSRSHILHLKTTQEEHYTITMDWDGSVFCGINIDWNYPAGTVDLNMPNYLPHP
jgi:hypothetical protein